MIFKDLTPEEVKEYKQWARDNYIPGTQINELWHPVVREECLSMNKERTAPLATGFYDLKVLTKEQLTEFFTDAVELSYDSHIDKLDVSKSWARQRTADKTLAEMINGCSPDYHNVCIDRSVQNASSDYGEIGYNIISGKYFLYIFVTLDNLNKLIDKYKLQER